MSSQHPTFHKIQFVPAATASKHLKQLSSLQQQSSNSNSRPQHSNFECGRFLPSRFQSQFIQFQLTEHEFTQCIVRANRIVHEFQHMMNRLDETNSSEGNSQNGKLFKILAWLSSLPSCGLSLLILYHLWPKLKKRKRLEKIQQLRVLCKQKLEQFIEEENETFSEKEIRLELVFGPVQYPILNEDDNELMEPHTTLSQRSHSMDGMTEMVETMSNDGDAADSNSYEDPFTTVNEKRMDHSLEDHDEKFSIKNQQHDDYNDGSYILKRNAKSELTKSQLLKGLIKSPRRHYHLSSQDTKSSGTTSTAPENSSSCLSTAHSHITKLPTIEIFEENQVPHIRFISNNRKSVYLMDYYRTAQRDSSNLNSPALLFKRNFSDVEEMSGSLNEENNLFPSELKGVQFDYTNFHPLNPYRKI
ncbi:hypothetical protein C9374_007578 [Naegleria lovaniensis]|uniref:Uncharacterized protein n=1 Tax=Naegleria lovaniensis TaxID=51637 RepID=A0AA88KGV9_NAELO|nr:uncharacterized protein C9374_007578 [Naegleria lovaniensis]KAG2378940.1 hypothetical protein C9374_007578 [Naegleria lovaniensis]